MRPRDIPLYFPVDLTGRQYEAPEDYPQFFYGFLSAAMAWQTAFLELGHVAGVAVRYGQGR